MIIFLVIAISPPAFGQGFEKMGLAQDLTIETGGYSFEVETTSSYDITGYEFDSDEKRLTVFISSTVNNNLGEFLIPKNLINGNFTFFLNDEEIFPNVRGNERISFITIEFPGKGFHQLDIIGTTYLPEFSEVLPLVLATSMFGILFLKIVRKKLFIN